MNPLPEKAVQPPTDRPTPRVLVVDDDPAMVRLIRLALVSEGFEVVVAGDGTRGLEEIQRGEFDLLVLDLQMPVMDGRTMFREMRSSGVSIPVLILSAFGAESARSELGADAAMAKPFDVDDLVERVKSVVGSRGE